MHTGDINGMGVLRLLEIIRQLSNLKKIKFYQASTSELYGKVVKSPQDENTPFYPRSPYAVAKLYAYWATINYRESYNLFACNGILFNHESPRRGPDFVTRKIVQGMVETQLGMTEFLELGNLDALRDWGHARDYVRAMWMMLQQDTPDDYVIATGRQYSVRDFCHAVAENLNFGIRWQGSGLHEVGYNTVTGKPIIKINERYYRPAEVNSLIGNPIKANQKLGWYPKFEFRDLVHDMCRSELTLYQK
jgi:GDPmannose 4,6-dehydratase